MSTLDHFPIGVLTATERRAVLLDSDEPPKPCIYCRGCGKRFDDASGFIAHLRVTRCIETAEVGWIGNLQFIRGTLVVAKSETGAHAKRMWCVRGLTPGRFTLTFARCKGVKEAKAARDAANDRYPARVR
jgi:hypothetical protein